MSKELLDALLEVKRLVICDEYIQGESLRGFGICLALPLVSSNKLLKLEFARLYKKWPEYSGNPTYPVPSPDGKYTPEQAFDYTCEDKYAGEYGAARMRLLNWCIEELQK